MNTHALIPMEHYTTSNCNGATGEDSMLPSIIIPLDEFSYDLENRLGRANGNVFHRKEGVEGVHDGQIMVRLKKKRFIVIDYGIVPTQADLQAAAIHPHVTTPDGAGKTKCITPSCTKVGVPVLLYDSEPSEPASLYIRSGLCFTCQRNLNEKRRTQRKRKNDVILQEPGGTCRAKLNGNIIDLSSDALVINGPMEGVKKHVEGFSAEEIAADLQALSREAAFDMERLLNSAQTNPETTAVAFAAALVTNPLHPSDVMATSAAIEVSSSAGLMVQEHQHNQPQHHLQQHSQLQPSHGDAIENCEILYERALTSTSKVLYLLTQWKLSWDASADSAHCTVHEQAQALIPLLVAANKQQLTGETEDANTLIVPPTLRPVGTNEEDSVFQV